MNEECWRNEIVEALKPAEVADVSFCFELGRATAVVSEDQLGLAIGKGGWRIKHAGRKTGWDIDILTPSEFETGLKRLDATLRSIDGMNEEMVENVKVLGVIDVRDIEEIGTGPLVEELGFDPEMAQRVVARCADVDGKE